MNSGQFKKVHGHQVGGKGSPTYSSWQAMKTRCFNQNTEDYKRYGAQGITVCDRWRDSFAAFLEDMGPRLPDTTLDRWPDGGGNYEPGNCRWATRKEQQQNMKSNRSHVVYEGTAMPLKRACELAGISYETALCRLRRGTPWDQRRMGNNQYETKFE